MLRQIRGLRMDITELDSIGEPRNGPVQQLLKKRSGRTTVPQVFVNSEFIGGDDDMKRLASAGALEAALKAAVN
jgi:glutaredoxin-related protein